MWAMYNYNWGTDRLIYIFGEMNMWYLLFWCNDRWNQKQEIESISFPQFKELNESL